MSKMKKLIVLLVTLTMVFASAVPSFAIVAANQPAFGGNTYYEQTSPSDYYVDGEITVHLHVTTFKYPAGYNIDRVYDVTVGTAGHTNQLITVKDVLEKAATDNSNLAFTIQTVWNSNYLAYDSTLTSVEDSINYPSLPFGAAILYNGSTAYACGYMFRINGMIPYFTHTNVNNVTKTEGCLINNAYVTNNDTVDLYYKNIYKKFQATRVEYVDRISYTQNLDGQTYSATFQFMEGQCYYNTNDDDWTLTNWAVNSNYKNSDVIIYIDGVSNTVHLDSNTQFTISNLSAGTHSFRFKTSYAQFATSQNGSIYYDVPSRVGMLSYFTF